MRPRSPHQPRQRTSPSRGDLRRSMTWSWPPTTPNCGPTAPCVASTATTTAQHPRGTPAT
eukprot:11208538-Lingulodinium_polyedra.AAC.1